MGRPPCRYRVSCAAHSGTLPTWLMADTLHSASSVQTCVAHWHFLKMIQPAPSSQVTRTRLPALCFPLLLSQVSLPGATARTRCTPACPVAEACCSCWHALMLCRSVCSWMPLLTVALLCRYHFRCVPYRAVRYPILRHDMPSSSKSKPSSCDTYVGLSLQPLTPDFLC